MNLNLVNRAAFLILFITISIYSQPLSFEKKFIELDKFLGGHQITELGPDNFMISGYTAFTSSLIPIYLQNMEIDENGNLKWVKKYYSRNLYNVVTKPFLKLDDEKYLMISTDINDGSERVKLLEIDTLGFVVDSIIYSGSDKEFGYDIIENGENFLLVAAKKINSLSFNKLKLINVDMNKQIVWEKEFDMASKNAVGFKIEKYGENKFVIHGTNDLLIINNDGGIQNTISSFENISSIKIDAEDIIIAGRGYLAKIKNDATVIWKIETMGATDILYVNDLHELFIAESGTSESYLKKTDGDGNLIKENMIRGNAYDLIETSGKEYFCTGKIDDYLWLLKLDSNFEYKSVELRSPQGGEKLIFTSKPNFTIEWYSHGFENIDIMFSSDSAKTWQSIELNYPAALSSYDWVLPSISSEECFVKIIGAPNSGNFSKNYKAFSITPLYTNSYNYISANEIFMWIGNNGMSAHEPVKDDSGLYWPGGANASVAVTFTDGILWGGTINRETRVNGATYRYGLQPGPILPDGTADNPEKTENRIYKLTKDWQSLPGGLDRDIYQYNYDNWPAEHGAPYEDVNGDGNFTRGTDKPAIIGDETLFYVANDLDTAKSTFTYGSVPIGLEFQQTLYAYNTMELKDAVFKKIKIINKGNDTVEKMYIAYWADDDLGFAGDDFIGCDTLLNMGFTYNGDNFDEDYYGEAPPAIGRVLLQGPIVESKYDTARVGGKEVYNYKNLPLTSSFFYIGASVKYDDPVMGVPAGSEMFYNNMQGLIWDGSPIIDPNTKQTTKFCLAGDPNKATGWYEGAGFPGGESGNDRRNLISSGPFNLAPGESQEVVFAIFLARGTDNLNSVVKLKEKAIDLHKFWGNKIITNVDENDIYIPDEYSLSQNYPNPFNPATTIEYSVPEISNVQLTIYNVLGQLVETLVDERQKPGKYKVNFNAAQLSSGVYMYRLKTDSFIQSRKMLLVK